MKKFVKDTQTPSRTLLKQDMILFSELLDGQLQVPDINQIDPRLTMMISVGLLNRKLDLEKDLVAVLGQDWSFGRRAKVGETLSVKYELQRNRKAKKPVYLVKITLLSDEETVGTGHWSLLLKRELEEDIHV